MLEREDALKLLADENFEPNLMQHALASEAVLEALARRFELPEEEVKLWAMTGLLHDVDYPRTKDDPARHGLEAEAILTGKLPAEAVYAIKAHNGECTGVQPESRFDFALRCGETVTGLISAAALVRPNGLEGMEPKSLKKKMKDKAFAASVNRETIRECEKIGLELDEFLRISIDAMRKMES
ncbi:MAG: HDIG domain-containing protein [Desulfovibrionaceae bacterium]|nr:HDIG domain-containing protein [Desulfovibrionaceae bacterium]